MNSAPDDATDGSSPTNPLQLLISLSKVDGALARAIAERNKLEEQLSQSEQDLKNLKRQCEDKGAEVKDRRYRYDREEKRLQEEQQKLVDRRKALSSFTDYKLQQRAEKEIEQVAKQLSQQETALLATLDELESAEKEVEELHKKLEEEEGKHASESEDVKANIVTLGETIKEREAERAEEVKGVNPELLQIYDRTRTRYPVDPMVAISGTNCSACFMQVAPQIKVQLARGGELVRCRGCQRILFLGEDKEE